MRRLAFIVVVAVLAAGCGGIPKTATSVIGGNPADACGFTKDGIYLELATSSKAVRQIMCGIFDRSFGGKRFDVSSAVGTGKAYCEFKKTVAGHTVEVGALASTDTLGKAFCDAFSRGHNGFKQIYP